MIRTRHVNLGFANKGLRNYADEIMKPIEFEGQTKVLVVRSRARRAFSFARQGGYGAGGDWEKIRVRL